jgi:hypothetical protein
MEFKEKWDEIVKKMMDEDLEAFEFDDDEAYHKMYAIGQRLPQYVVNWPMVAKREEWHGGQKYMEIEEIDVENIEIEIFEDHVHVVAGGDWQFGADFDLVLNENSLDLFPFLACNIRCVADINGKNLDDEDDDDEEEIAQFIFCN